MTLVRPELRLELRTALFQACAPGKSVEAQARSHHSTASERFVTMIARPCWSPS
jgi:two-component system CheB/CheR fusion protein